MSSVKFILLIEEVESHLIEQKQRIVMIYGRFIPQDVAIKIRKKTNRRVEILEIQQLVSPTHSDNYQGPIIHDWK